MGQTKKDNHLDQQAAAFVRGLETANSKRDIQRISQDYKFIRDFYCRIIQNRNARADEIDSPQYNRVLQITKRLLPYPISLLRCMDGRAFGPLIGLFGHVGQSVTVAGGTINEFVRLEATQKFYLLPNSNYAEYLREALRQHKITVHVEIMDSHLGCAAREAAENAKGRFPKDHGLFADVVQKQAMCKAVFEYINQKYKGKRKIIAMQISLDLHSGFMYMGLGTKEVIEKNMAKQSYDDVNLRSLVHKGEIISTESLANEPEIAKIFHEYAFPIDLVNEYGTSAVRVWEAVEQMFPKLRQILAERLYKVYPRLKNSDYEYAYELNERAVILLVNAFIGYLHKTQFKTFPFAQHHEEGIFLGKGSNTPYAIDMFGISTLDMDSVPANVELSAALVRANRNSKRVQAGSRFFAKPEQFVAAPVCAVMQVKVLDNLSEAEWKQVSSISWNEFEEFDWTTMSDQEFLDYLEEQNPDIPTSVVNAMNKLRHRLAFLYRVDRVTSPFLIEQDIVILPVISDTSLRIRAVLPFWKTGYK